MTPPEDIRGLVGDDVPEPELARLQRADDALRSTGAAPEVTDSLTARVLAIPDGQRRTPWRARRVLAGLALAAAFAAAMFGVGLLVGGDESEGTPAAERVVLNATAEAPQAARMVLDVLPVDKAGNWRMAGEVSGLAPLPRGGYYEVWLTRNGRTVDSCGRFVVAADGAAEDVWLNAPYDFKEYDRWVVTAHRPGAGDSRWLLSGPVGVPA